MNCINNVSEPNDKREQRRQSLFLVNAQEEMKLEFIVS